MNELLADIEVTLPLAPVQKVPQAKRTVTAKGTINQDGSRDVAVDVVGPFVIRGGLNATITISVIEVLANGKASAPASIMFTPMDFIEVASADPTGFEINIVSVDSAQVTDSNVPVE